MRQPSTTGIALVADGMKRRGARLWSLWCDEVRLGIRDTPTEFIPMMMVVDLFAVEDK
jgi:hypothetical protein